MAPDDSEIVVPNAAPLINFLRAIGYSLENAIADIIDNGIDMVLDSEKDRE